MSITIELTFPAGRYHATPWGRHVNEGVPEWPPSPWRLLRALVAVWKRTCPDLAEQQVKRVLTALAFPPFFRLPTHRVAHTRHYMPWEKKGPADRTLVFDTFVSIGRKDPLLIGWPEVELLPEDRQVLAKLLSNLTSLGRAEGWIHAELIDSVADWNCAPCETDANPVPVFCPDPATAFGNEHYPKLDPKKLARGKLSLSDFLFDCPRWHLCLDTETIHENRWPTVPGARWVNYSRPLEVRLVAPRRETKKPIFKVVRFLIDGPVLPLVTDTLHVAEAFRLAAMGRFRTWCQAHESQAAKYVIERLDGTTRYASQTLSGKNQAAVCLTGHNHAYYLPTAEGSDPRRITHVTLFAREGVDHNEVDALSGLRCLRVGKLDGLRVQLIGLGRPGDFRLPGDLFGRAREWVSLTPFIGPAHIGMRSKGRYLRKALGREVRRWLGMSAGLGVGVGDSEHAPAQVVVAEIEPAADTLGVPRPWEFRRARERKPGDGYRRPCGNFRLTLPSEVEGPIGLGYGCHFGMGMFRPVGVAWNSDERC